MGRLYDLMVALALPIAVGVSVLSGPLIFLLYGEGYAESAPFPPNLAHQGELDQAEARARAGGRGLWPACGGTDAPIGPVASAP